MIINEIFSVYINLLLVSNCSVRFAASHSKILLVVAVFHLDDLQVGEEGPFRLLRLLSAARLALIM